MKKHVFVDARHPDLNLIIIQTEDADLELEKVEVEVEEGQSVTEAVRVKLGI